MYIRTLSWRKNHAEFRVRITNGKGGLQAEIRPAKISKSEYFEKEVGFLKANI
jgi:hypothetical protein